VTKIEENKKRFSDPIGIETDPKKRKLIKKRLKELLAMTDEKLGTK